MIHIFKSEKDGQWYVRHVAKNGEPLSTSEGLKTRNNALKNIRAHMKIHGSESVKYWDAVKEKIYTLYQTHTVLASGRKTVS